MLKSQPNISNQEKNKWFEELIAAIQTHHFMLETNSASQELKKFYDAAMEGDGDKLALQNKNIGQRHFIGKMVVDYLSQLSELQRPPHNLAFDLADTEILVWAEIDNSDDEMEKQLLLAEAKVNAKYHQFGYDMTSMIVEKSDNLSIPSQYVVYKRAN